MCSGEEDKRSCALFLFRSRGLKTRRMAIRGFLEDASEVEQLFSAGEYGAAIGKAYVSCAQEQGSPESPALRDARSQLLCKTIVSLCMNKSKVNEEAMKEEDLSFALVGLHGLLERRLFNWLNNGTPETELLALANSETPYDPGFDEPLQLCLEDFARERSCSEERKHWLAKTAVLVQQEKEARVYDLVTMERHCVGTYVRVEGLTKTAALNGQRCVITKKLGERRGVILDDPKHGVKAIQKQHLVPVACLAIACPKVYKNACDHGPPDDCEQVETIRDHMRSAALWAQNSGYHRTDIAARASFLKKHIVAGTTPAPRCGDAMAPRDQWDELMRLSDQLRPPCVGDGAVNFSMFGAGDNVKRARCFREWLVSGLCHMCQTRTRFGLV